MFKKMQLKHQSNKLDLNKSIQLLLTKINNKDQQMVKIVLQLVRTLMLQLINDLMLILRKI